jgi:hypothetical protein
MTSAPQPLLFMTLAAMAGWLMTRAGLAKHLLEQRRRRRACPTCGRLDPCGCRR